jgi:hypothetical protein
MLRHFVTLFPNHHLLASLFFRNSKDFLTGMEIANYQYKGVRMKRIFIFMMCLTIVAMVFGGLLKNLHLSVRESTAHTACILDQLAPAIAYADSDTLDHGDKQPPPPPIL